MTNKRKLLTFIGVVTVMAGLSQLFPESKQTFLIIAVVINVAIAQYK